MTDEETKEILKKVVKDLKNLTGGMKSINLTDEDNMKIAAVTKFANKIKSKVDGVQTELGDN